MPSSPAAARALLAVAAALALAACHKADPEVRPFAIRVVGPTGNPIPAQPEFLPATFAALAGQAEWVGPGELRVDDPSLGGKVTVTFDAAAQAGAVFPLALHGKEVRVAVLVDPTRLAPDGTPIPYPALRLGVVTVTGGVTYRLLLVDSPYADDREVGAKPRPIGQEVDLGDDPASFPDFPDYAIEASSARFEPGDCGLVYHDALVVLGDDERARIWAGERASTLIGGDPDAWTTLHVDSWHRAGSCGGRAKTWTQWAAWR